MAGSIVNIIKSILFTFGNIYNSLLNIIPKNVLNLLIILIVFVLAILLMYVVDKLYSKYPTIVKKTILIFAIISIFIFIVSDFTSYLRFSPDGIKIVAKTQNFLTILLSIIIETFPFIILGVTISTLVGIGFFEWIVKIIYKYKKILFPFYYSLLFFKFIDSALNKSRFYTHLKASLIGVFLPVCECGNIPLARRLMLNGYSPSQAITFLLSAPVLNPVTFYTTFIAFQAVDPSIAYIRIGTAFFMAYIIGIIFSYKKDQNELITHEFYEMVCDHNHDHESDFEGKTLSQKIINKLKQAYEIFQAEFIDIMKVLSFGAILAAASQVFINRDFILAIGSNPVFSVIALIVFAFVISVCSNVDAFIALSFYRTFTKGSIVSFLVFGPIIDIKILAMMKKSFTTKTLIYITTLVTLFSILAGLIVNYYSR